MEIITRVERRRRWRCEEKLRIVAEVERPGASFNDVARRHEVRRGLLLNWRRQVRAGVLAPEPLPVFVPVQITPDAPSLDRLALSSPCSTASKASSAETERIEIALPDTYARRAEHFLTLRQQTAVLHVGENQEARSKMYVTTDGPIVSDVAHLRLAELATLKVWGDLYGLDVDIKAAAAGFTGEMAFIGFGNGIAAWCIYWINGRLCLAFLPDPSRERPEGWMVAVGSVEEAMARIIASTEE